MNWKRYAITVVAVFLGAVTTGFLVHAVLLESAYASIPNASVIYRSDQDLRGFMPLLWVGYLGFALGSVWVYAQGVSGRPWLGQGLRFGAAMWLVLTVPSFLIAAAVQPIPIKLAISQIGYELINRLLIGALTAALYRQTAGQPSVRAAAA